MSRKATDQVTMIGKEGSPSGVERTSWLGSMCASVLLMSPSSYNMVVVPTVEIDSARVSISTPR
jgi:hypothetical protein